MPKILSSLIILLLFSCVTKSQNTQDTLSNGFIQYKYPSGVISSQGYMLSGKPNGYWKNYYENGCIKSEGNRKNFELDSLWKFYDDSAHLLVSIEYIAGKKNGLKTTYRRGETMTETFVNDVKQGPSSYYYPNGKERLVVNFIGGLEEGVARELDTTGKVITYLEYKKGFLVNKERINRIDSKGLKQGRWKFFNEKYALLSEGVYKNDKKNGYFKTYDAEGNLLTVKKFVNDVEQVEAPELVSLTLKTDYYPSGKVKTVASYNGNIPEGVRREYNEDGNITSAYFFVKGVMLGEGIIDEEGNKQGAWKEYYTDASLRSIGNYLDNKRIGDWKFFYENGKIESAGKYTNSGLLEGEWRWYYEDGNLHRLQYFIAGLEDGSYQEYDETGKLIVKGEFVEGMEEGEWITDFGYYKEIGTYRGGTKHGTWKSYYDDGSLRFQGNYIDDNLNGKVIWYWHTGKIKDQGNYVNGKRDGDWIVYNEDGTPFLIINYKNDVEKRYDGISIKPPFEE